jgi:hypothetical protein
MLGANKAAVLLVWVLTVAAAFAVGRSTAPAGSDPAPENLATAIRAALGEPDVLDRAERTARLLRYLGPENVAGVVEVYDGMLNILGELAIRPFVAAWARFDPEAALKHTLRWPFRDKKEMGAGTAIEAWALRDPDAALEAYERLSERNPGLQEVLFLNMLTGWVYSGRGGVEDYIANLQIGKLDDAITRVAAKTLRSGGVDALMRWVDSITGNDAYENKFKKKAFQRGSRMVARLDPERAAAWVIENRGQAYALDGPRIIAEQWGMQDGRAALEWVRNHPDEEVHHQAAREAFRTWSQSDQAGALEWLESERLTTFHDSSVVYYAKELGHRAPAEAVGWCERVVDEQRRLSCLKKTATQWYRRNAVAAETWLQQSPLDEETRRTVRTPRKKQQPRRSPAEKRAQGSPVERP